MNAALKSILDVAHQGKAWARKGAYTWALVRYAQAAAMGQLLVTLLGAGQVTLSQAEIRRLQETMLDVRRWTEAARSKLTNGHSLSGKSDQWPLSDLAGILIEEMDAAFFSQ